jgi:hypothetical protein
MANQKPMIKPSHRGLFTAKAKGHGMTPGEFSRYVLSHKGDYDTSTIKQAVFDKNFAGKKEPASKKKKSVSKKKESE